MVRSVWYWREALALFADIGMPEADEVHAFLLTPDARRRFSNRFPTLLQPGAGYICAHETGSVR
jgi:hypothetical protein